MRRVARHLLDRRMLARSLPIDVDALAQRCLVVAPHPDDETLGCGGLVAELVRTGRIVDVVFMTDGTASHPAMAAVELAGARRAEAQAALLELGLAADHAHFLDIPDGGLADDLALATDALADLVAAIEPGLVIAPHPHEPPADHAAAFEAVSAAFERTGSRVPALLYGVWLWDQFPWTNPFAALRAASTRQALTLAARERGGLRMLGRFTHRLDLDDGGAVKRQAIERHTTQMSRAGHDGPTLADVAGGDWLHTLLRPFELYAGAELGSRVPR